MKVDPQSLIVYLPDTRGVSVSRFGRGNMKIGMEVFTYSRMAGARWTCPGASEECEAICYAKRVMDESGEVAGMWARNSATESIPDELPPGTQYLRLHISGDFTTVEYIDAWTRLLSRHHEVVVWAYTRSWRVPALLPALERLRALPHVQLFASMDESIPEMPPVGWRRAWIDGDPRVTTHPDRMADKLRSVPPMDATPATANGLVCPEETGMRPDCVRCGFCFKPTVARVPDVVFLRH